MQNKKFKLKTENKEEALNYIKENLNYLIAQAKIKNKNKTYYYVYEKWWKKNDNI